MVVGKTFLAFLVHAQPAILRIWQEAHVMIMALYARNSFGDTVQIWTWYSASKHFSDCITWWEWVQLNPSLNKYGHLNVCTFLFVWLQLWTHYLVGSCIGYYCNDGHHVQVIIINWAWNTNVLWDLNHEDFMKEWSRYMELPLYNKLRGCLYVKAASQEWGLPMIYRKDCPETILFL